MGDDWTGIVFDVDMEGIKELFADGTKIKRQDGTKGDLRLLIGKNKVGKDMEHQRCLWHGGRDLGYVLWKRASLTR